MTQQNSVVSLGQIVYCKLTGKQLIIQKIHYKTNENPMYAVQEREVSYVTVRYLSQKHDEFKNTDVFIHDILLNKPDLNNVKTPFKYGN